MSGGMEGRVGEVWGWGMGMDMGMYNLPPMGCKLLEWVGVLRFSWMVEQFFVEVIDSWRENRNICI